LNEEKVCVGSTCCLSIVYSPSEDRIPIVLLHGYSFSSYVWKEIGLLQKLEEKEIPFIALDMPYGVKSQCTNKTSDALMNLSLLEEIMNSKVKKGKPPVLVGASMGGYIAILYSESNPVSGLILIGPVGTEEERVKEKAKNIEAPVLIIAGEKDTIIDLEAIKSFASQLPRAEIRVYESSGHPAYLYKKERFTEEVVSFYESLEEEST